jgi:hypothetical protein
VWSAAAALVGALAWAARCLYFPSAEQRYVAITLASCPCPTAWWTGVVLCSAVCLAPARCVCLFNRATSHEEGDSYIKGARPRALFRHVPPTHHLTRRPLPTALCSAAVIRPPVDLFILGVASIIGMPTRASHLCNRMYLMLLYCASCKEASLAEHGCGGGGACIAGLTIGLSLPFFIELTRIDIPVWLSCPPTHPPRHHTLTRLRMTRMSTHPPTQLPTHSPPRPSYLDLAISASCRFAMVVLPHSISPLPLTRILSYCDIVHRRRRDLLLTAPRGRYVVRGCAWPMPLFSDVNAAPRHDEEIPSRDKV